MTSIITRSLLRCGAASSLRFGFQNTVYRAPAALAAPVRAQHHETAVFTRDTTIHLATDADKVTLVKANMYRTVEDVPHEVPISQVRKARDYMRIRVSIWMLAATAIGCLGTVFYGRKLRYQGDTLTHREQRKINALRTREGAN